MYHPSEDQAHFDLERSTLSKELSSTAARGRFVKNLKLARGHLLQEEITDRHFVDCDFRNLQWMQTHFERCNWTGVKLHDCELRDLSFRNCSFHDVEFVGAMVGNVSFESCFFENCNFSRVALEIAERNSVHYEKKPALTTPKPQVTREKTFAQNPVNPAPTSQETLKAAPPQNKLPSGRFGQLDI